MTEPVVRDTAPVARPGAGLARAALMITAVAVIARAVGFGRVLVFARTVGPTCLGDTYYTANTIPNIVFDIVAGGALASLVVPVLAGAVDRGDEEAARRTSSALLTWAVVGLAPLAVVGALLAHPLMSLLVGGGHPGCDRDAAVDVGARMLVVFMPQVVLYGIGIVLTGVLQAHRRFLGPALAPLLSSLVVIAAYVSYGVVSSGQSHDLRHLPLSQELLLSVGTTVGVVALSLPLFLPLRRTPVRLRPTLSFPPGVARQVRRLAVSGAAVLAGQQVATAVVLRLANAGGSSGAVVVYGLAWTLFLVPWAVLAVPIATSAFPTLTARHSDGDEAGYADLVARTTRIVVIVTAAAAAILAASAGPAARVLVLGTRGGVDPVELARAIVAFAPGLLGYGLLAHLSRALYARGDARGPALAAIAGWASVIVADIALVAALPRQWSVAGLGIGNSIGMTVAGLVLLAALARATGGAGMLGLPRAAGAGLVGGVVAGAAGVAVAAAAGSVGALASVGQCALVAVVVAAVFAVVALLLDRPDALALARRVSRA